MPKLNPNSPPKVRPELPRLCLTIAEAAAALGLSKSTIYNLLGDGTLPFAQVRGKRLIAVTAIEALLAPAAKEG